MAVQPALLLPGYSLGDVIGIGAFGTVRQAKCTKTGKIVAVKFISKSSVKPRHEEQELSNHRLMKHCNIVNLIEDIDSPKFLALVLDFAANRDLLECMNRCHRVLPENTARHIFLQLVAALSHCHSHGVAHLDVKMENILFTETYEVKLADFGHSIRLREGEMLTVPRGTPQYQAPEMLVTGCRFDGRQADVWSCGVVLFALLTHRLPFPYEPTLFAKIKQGSYSIPEHVSEEAADLVRRMLEVDPARRISIEEVANHPWSLSATLSGTVEAATAVDAEGAPRAGPPPKSPIASTGADGVPAAAVIARPRCRRAGALIVDRCRHSHRHRRSGARRRKVHHAAR